MKIHCCDESSSVWWKLFTVWHFVTVSEICKSNENSIKVVGDEIHHCDENLFHVQSHWGLLFKTLGGIGVEWTGSKGLEEKQLWLS